MKIHIIGGSGSGKSYFAEQLSRKYNIEHIDLDNLFWDNTAKNYGVKMPIDKRTEKLNDILDKDGWIIEGVYYAWVEECFKQADKIFVLMIPPIVYKYRIVRRYFRRKIGIEKGKKETLKSLIKLLKWTDKFDNENMIEIMNTLDKYKDKVLLISKSKDIWKYIRFNN